MKARAAHFESAALSAAHDRDFRWRRVIEAQSRFDSEWVELAATHRLLSEKLHIEKSEHLAIKDELSLLQADAEK